MKGGVRYEHTWQNYSSSAQTNAFRTDYGSLVPTASIQWSPSMTQNIGISYNMRISRPGISYLNPYVDTTDPTALTYGNTDLEVERGHNISLVYSAYTPKVMVNATLRYSYTGNEHRHEPEHGPERLHDAESHQQDPHHDQRRPHLQRHRQRAARPAQQRMGLQPQSFLNDRLSFSVNGMLPLAKGFEMSMSSHTVGKGFVSDMSTTIPMRQITFQVSWTFGKQGNYSAKRASRTIQNEDQLNSTTTAESMGSIMMQ